MRIRALTLSIACLLLAWGAASAPTASAESASADSGTAPRFSRHVVAVFSRLGCNGGTCHGAVQGQNGFRLSLFGAKPADDHEQLVRHAASRRVNLIEPEKSLLLLKATAQVPHGGGRVTRVGSLEYEALRGWIAAGAQLDNLEKSRVVALVITPPKASLQLTQGHPLRAAARFADGSTQDVTPWCSFKSQNESVAVVDRSGQVRAVGVGDTALIVRYRDEPAVSQVIVGRVGSAAFPDVKPNNFVDEHVLAKLRRLNVHPSPLCDDATFLRRARLDVTGQLPTPEEVRAFLADADPNKRAKKIDQLLDEPGYAALWTLKFCDLLGASDFGVYADGLAEHFEAPRFQAWVRARFEENTPYDEFAARILLATSREGRDLKEWADEVVALQEGYATPRKDLEIYAKRKTLDAYWQRKAAVGVSGALQVAHTFLGLRLECAQCHRHPHDVWQQDDLLSFANFFTRVRTVGFQGDNEKQFPADAEVFKQFTAEGKKLADEAKALKEGKGKQLAEEARKAPGEINKLKSESGKHDQEAKQFESQAKQKRDQAAALPADKAAEAESLVKEAAELEDKAKQQQEQATAQREQIMVLEQAVAENEKVQAQIRDLERRGRLLGDDVAKRVLHAQIFHRADDKGAKSFATITSPLGTQSSKDFRLLGDSVPLEIAAEVDPREKVVEWLRRPDNPFFAKAIVNRVWAHYFGRGIIDPADDLSPLNPPTHPELLDELCRRFALGRFDLKLLHRAILNSRTYQQTAQATADNEMDRANYAYFYLRRLPAEVLLDALNQATGTSEPLDMKYFHWPDGLKTVELPYLPKNAFVTFMLEQLGRPQRNSSVQCDCQRQGDASLLQVLSFANHPRVWQKIADPAGRVAMVVKQTADEKQRVEELYLLALGRVPNEAELEACRKYIGESESPDKGLQGVLWSLLNTKEFVLQH